jgi:hypothetical protein
MNRLAGFRWSRRHATIPPQHSRGPLDARGICAAMASQRAALLPIVLVALLPATARAQDSQYWNLQYGPVAELVGGAVVGTTRDLSATFYNPGALALTRDPSLLASVESFEAVRIKAVSPPPVLDFSDLRVRPSPSLFAFALPRSLTGSHTFAVSGLTRQDFDLRVDNWQVAPSQGGAEALFDQSLNENWFGLSWAHHAGEQFGLGLTSYVVYRGQRTRKEISGQAQLSPAQGGAALLVEDFDYSNYRLLWKAGFSTQRESWDAGLAVTTPSVRLFGSGSASYTRSTVGADLGSGPVVSVAVQHADDLESRYESPWSVAGGGGYRWGSNRLHATVEWFGAVSGFDVLDTGPFASDPAAAGLLKRLHHTAKSVVNFGVGYERTVSDRLSWYGAFTTDFTFAEKEDSATNSLSTWDIYHLTAGASLVVRSVKLTMGAAYAFGSDLRSISTLLVPPGGPPALTTTPLDVKFSRLRLLLGFDFGR